MFVAGGVPSLYRPLSHVAHHPPGAPGVMLAWPCFIFGYRMKGIQMEGGVRVRTAVGERGALVSW